MGGVWVGGGVEEGGNKSGGVRHGRRLGLLEQVCRRGLECTPGRG